MHKLKHQFWSFKLQCEGFLNCSPLLKWNLHVASVFWTLIEIWNAVKLLLVKMIQNLPHPAEPRRCRPSTTWRPGQRQVESCLREGGISSRAARISTLNCCCSHWGVSYHECLGVFPHEALCCHLVAFSCSWSNSHRPQWLVSLFIKVLHCFVFFVVTIIMNDNRVYMLVGDGENVELAPHVINVADL